MSNEHLRYPVGRFQAVENPDEITVLHWIDTIETFPAKLRALTGNLSNEQLALTYREGGWTIRQIIHHVVDSHVNSYIRFKWTLTEDNPTIKTYDQNAWSSLPDAMNGPASMSLNFLEALHARWVYVLRSLTPEQRKRTFVHPEKNATFDLNWMISMYAWHCRHHYGHVELALKNAEKAKA
jgi:hypothetical protein